MSSAARPATWVIVNPAAGAGQAERRWPALADRLHAAGLAFTAAVTCRPGDATWLARDAAAGGATTIAVVGGDGTVNEVVNGLLAAGADSVTRPALAILPAGTGADFARSRGIRSLDGAIAALLHGQAQTIDLGHVTFRDEAGGEQTRLFANVADCGLGPIVSQQIAGAPKGLGPAAYFYGALRAIAGYRPVEVRVGVDDHIAYTGPSQLVAVANSAYFGGGMHIAPKASSADGQFDIVILGDVSRAALTTDLLPRVYRGAHLRHPAIHFARGAAVTIETSAPLPLETDGEIAGTTPARFTLLPGALHVLHPTET
ncbi:MAG: diacylglycerol/lipid kinase family protein [Thermomicrobiales bacterium]